MSISFARIRASSPSIGRRYEVKERGITVIFVSFLAIFICLSWITPAIAYQLDADYKFTLRSGNSLQGKIIRVDSTTVTIEDSSKTKQIIKRSEIVRSSRATRTYSLEDLQKLPKLSYESKEPPEDKEKKVSRTYGGKSEEYWISETLRLALKSKKAEESYEQLIRDCRLSKDQTSCLKANQKLIEIERTRKEYNQFLTLARQASAPVAWLDTHYKWIRWGQEWKN